MASKDSAKKQNKLLDFFKKKNSAGGNKSLFTGGKKLFNFDKKTTTSSTSQASSNDVDAVRLTLVGGAYHSTPIVAEGNAEGNTQKGRYHWYRADTGSLFAPICETELQTYTPSIDDVGCRICCQWVPENGLPSAFCEYGPLAADPVVVQRLQALEDPTEPAVFPAVASDRKTSLQISLSEDSVVIRNDAGGILMDLTEVPDLELGLNAKNPKKLKLVSDIRHILFRCYLDSGVSRDVFAVYFRKKVKPEEQEDSEEAQDEALSTTTTTTTTVPAAVLAAVPTTVPTTAVEAAVATTSTATSTTTATTTTTVTGHDTIAAVPDSIRNRSSVSLSLGDRDTMNNSEPPLVQLHLTLAGVSLGDATDKIDALASELRKLKKTFKLSEVEFTAKLAAANAKNIALLQKQKHILNDLNAVRATNQELVPLQKQVVRLQTQQQSLTTERDALRIKIGDNASAMTNIGHLQEKSAALQESLYTVEARCKHLDDANKQLFGEKMAVERTLAEITTTGKQLEAQTIQLQQTQQELQKLKVQTAQETATYKTELSTQLSALAEAQQLTAEATQRMADVETDLNQELTLRQDAVSEMESQRNFYKRKAESLSTTVEKLLREQNVNVDQIKSPLLQNKKKRLSSNNNNNNNHDNHNNDSSSSNNSSSSSSSSSSSGYEQRLAEVQKAHDEASSALEVYKTAFEEQLQQLKQEREANMILAKRSSSRSDAAVQYRLKTLQQLANTLSETIGDKDIALDHMRKSNQMLGARVQELEARYIRRGSRGSSTTERGGIPASPSFTEGKRRSNSRSNR